MDKFGDSLSSAPENRSLSANPIFKSSRSIAITARTGTTPTINPRRMLNEFGLDKPNCEKFSLPEKNKTVKIETKKSRDQ